MSLKEKQLKSVYFAAGILLYLAFLLFYVNDAYPWVGHDYRYFIPRMLDTYIHYLNNGLSIQWFTPSFGGGLPAYPHPQNLQFSLNQLLTFFVNPWIANLLAISVFTLIGYYSFYRLLLDEIELNWMASGLGALFFIANGMLVQHSTTGTGYDGYPLVALVIFVLLSKRISIGWAGVVIALVLTLWVNSAGFYLFVILALTCLMAIPLKIFITSMPLNFVPLIKKFLLGLIIFSLLSGGKLYAVFAYMQHFPRVVIDDYYSSFGGALVGFVLQLIGVPVFTIPFRLLNQDPMAVGQMLTALVGGSEFGIWEMDVSISPMLLIILFYRVRKMISRINNRKDFKNSVLAFNKIRTYAGVGFFLAAWLAFDFTSARGVLYPLFRDLPLLSSLHNNIRYAGSFVLPLAMIGSYVFYRELLLLDLSKRLRIFSFFFATTLLLLGVYFFLPNDLQSRNFNLELNLSDYQRARAGESFYVSEVKDLIDYRVFSNHATSRYPYEPIFGYNNEEFLTKLTTGSIYLEDDGYFNLTNPRSLVYESDELFSRFTLDQREMMEEFAHYKQPDWDIPEIQHTLNKVSGGTFLLILLYGGYYAVYGRKRGAGKPG